MQDRAAVDAPAADEVDGAEDAEGVVEAASSSDSVRSMVQAGARRDGGCASSVRSMVSRGRLLRLIIT